MLNSFGCVKGEKKSRRGVNVKKTYKGFLQVQDYNTIPQPLRQILEKNL